MFVTSAVLFVSIRFILAEEPLVRGLLADLRGERVLDVGWNGRHTAWLHAERADVVGIDASRGPIAVILRGVAP